MWARSMQRLLPDVQQLHGGEGQPVGTDLKLPALFSVLVCGLLHKATHLFFFSHPINPSRIFILS